MEPIRAVQWGADGASVRIVDQRRLPAECVERELRTAEEVRDAIATLAVRGAPAIGVAAAMGLVTALMSAAPATREEFDASLRRAAAIISGARPTAVNLAWAVGRVETCARQCRGDAEAAVAAMREEANAILAEDRAMCDAIGRHGEVFITDGCRVLTHCNAGALATAGIGTALAPVYVAHGAGKRVSVIADETRPLLQGSRLTAWELGRAGIPVMVIADGMAGAMMRTKGVDIVLVGADRIAANGDVANKIGTYGLAVLARHHGVPFFVCAPMSTIDPATACGDDIVVEVRGDGELRALAGVQTAPEDARVWNPAFDVTPAELITAIITDTGVHRAPYTFQS
ncbi:MAG: S-methyl-5-thioribose-1-phosphate isomerase [Gemmatimonadetes bacterium]|nr:S-methyl-5-thioribose-1-phosphate isomerase [Gemmatimonadota bacterium]